MIMGEALASKAVDEKQRELHDCRGGTHLLADHS